jgi:hypothetical protein
MDRKLHVDTLSLIPTLKIYVFWHSRQTDRQTEALIWGGFRNYVPPGKRITIQKCVPKHRKGVRVYIVFCVSLALA